MVKKIFPWIFIILLITLLIIGFASKKSLNSFLSETMKEQFASEAGTSGTAIIDSLYNYSNNGSTYDITFLEFGAKGCSACKRMEKVMEEIRMQYPNKVNVVFYNILLPENQILMKYYGIVSIPTQVLLDKSGKEYFRHTGYYSETELKAAFKIAN